MCNMLHILFSNCINAIREHRLNDARDILLELSTRDFGIHSRALYDYLRAQVPLFEQVPTTIDSIALDDFGIIVLMTEGESAALARTINSVINARSILGRSLHCILFESLPPSTDVNALPNLLTPALPDYVREAIQAGVIDYMVDHGTTVKALRRAVRCSRGRHITLLREGDEIQVDSNSDIEQPIEFDIAVAVHSESAKVREIIATVFEAQVNLRALPALLATNFFYDGSFLIGRDYLDDLLGLVGYDGNEAYFGYLNEILTLALAWQSGGVGCVPFVGCVPAAGNLARHQHRLESYTLYCIAERRKSYRGNLERATEALLDSVLELARNAYLGKSTHPGKPDAPEEELLKVQTGYLPSLARCWVVWLTEQIHALNLAGPVLSSKRPALQIQASNPPTISFISSLFRGQHLVHSFLANITHQSAFPDSELIVVSPEPNLIQDLVCELLALASSRVRLIYLSNDPGIYECWNIAIHSARGRFISNANLDDRRDVTHVTQLVDLLESTGASVASAAVEITHDKREIEQSINRITPPRNGMAREIWFGNSAHVDHYRKLDDFFQFGAGGEVVQCMNFPHCMPVWRRELHKHFGYFDENANGTYADFAFWLQLAEKGEGFVHLTKALGLYYVDPESHNRRNAKGIVWQTIVGRHLPKDTRIKMPNHVDHVSVLSSGMQVSHGPVKFNFGNQIQQSFGAHRSGWSYVLAGLERFHDPSAPVYCDAFIEKKFVWGGDAGEGGAGPVIPYDKPWIGFVHVPPNIPSWFQSEQSNQRIFSRRSWKKSMEHCKGLFVLTEYHRQHLERMLKPNFPISVLRHPTEFPKVGFDYDRYIQNPRKRVVQIGWWLRKLDAITRISVPGHIPTLLGKDDWSKNLLTYSERRASGETGIPGRVEKMDFLGNDAYDQLLSENIVFLDFYDTSANNAIIECIARGTPIIVSRHSAVEEYIGRDYPLLFDNYDQIPKIIGDRNRILLACELLKNELLRRPLTLDAFLDNFASSEVVTRSSLT